MSNIKPVLDYVYGEEVTTETGVVTTTEVSDTKQFYKVLAVGEGRMEFGNHLAKPPCKVGDIVIIQKHAAEGDTPPKMLASGRALFLGSRIMAVEEE